MLQKEIDNFWKKILEENCLNLVAEALKLEYNEPRFLQPWEEYDHPRYGKCFIRKSIYENIVFSMLIEKSENEPPDYILRHHTVEQSGVVLITIIATYKPRNVHFDLKEILSNYDQYISSSLYNYILL